jgi:Spy/CpxP family protein refolding chaperone
MRNDPNSVSCFPSMPAFPHRLRGVFAGTLLVIALACVAQDGQAPSSSPVPPGGQPNNVQSPASNSAKLTRHQKALAADTDRKKQITDESSQLLAMAVALKAEVDKTNKDELSLNVIRKADEIEKLAHTVKEKIKQSGGPS